MLRDAVIGATVALLVSEFMRRRRISETSADSRPPYRSSRPSFTREDRPLRRHSTSFSGVRSDADSIQHRRASRPDGAAPPARTEGRSRERAAAAGDSDSDGDKESPDVPREMLSPVPLDQGTTIVVFGADGDLATKKLIPTLFALWQRRVNMCPFSSDIPFPIERPRSLLPRGGVHTLDPLRCHPAPTAPCMYSSSPGTRS